MADGPCREDIKKYCSDKKGKKEIALCMKDNKDSLSPQCKEKIAERIEKVKEKVMDLKENCTEDAKKLCPDIKPGKGAIIKCLKSKQSELSSKCSESMMKK